MIFTLNAETRKTIRKSDLSNLRAAGMIPAVLYGPGMDSITIALNKADFGKCYKKSFAEVAFYEIELNGNKYHTVLKDKQIHPVTRNFLHLDFMVVAAESTMDIEIPLKFSGDPVGLKEGGFMDIVHRTVKVSCKASDIPEDIELNISDLKVGDSKHVRDLPKGNWHYKENDDVTLIVIHAKATAMEKEVPASETKE